MDSFPYPLQPFRSIPIICTRWAPYSRSYNWSCTSSISAVKKPQLHGGPMSLPPLKTIESRGADQTQGVLSMFVIGLYMALLLDLATLWPKLSTLVICFLNGPTWRDHRLGTSCFFVVRMGPSFKSHGKNHLV